MVFLFALLVIGYSRSVFWNPRDIAPDTVLDRSTKTTYLRISDKLFARDSPHQRLQHCHPESSLARVAVRKSFLRLLVYTHGIFCSRMLALQTFWSCDMDPSPPSRTRQNHHMLYGKPWYTVFLMLFTALFHVPSQCCQSQR
jgi:hypothetical protein